MKQISIDIETFSDVDLKKCGVYKYAESLNAELLLFGYSVDGGEVQVVDITQGEKIPSDVLTALSDENIIKWAFNASFERVFLSIWLERNYPQYFSSYSINEDTVGNYLNPSSWRCSKVWCAYMGLPLSLESAGAVLGLDKQKMSQGADLIRYFCKPCKPTKANGNRKRNLPCHSPIKWQTFKAYNKRDVEVEMSIQKKLSRFSVPDFVWNEYRIDQMINDRGIAVDTQIVENAIQFDTMCKEELKSSLKEMTGLENPNSVQQMTQWLSENDIHTDSLDKKAVENILKTAPEPISNALKLRKQLAKSSVSKYYAMKEAVCSDGRERGMFQFYGASRSGRWAGRIIQLQNLPQNHIDDLASARSVLKYGDYEMMKMLYENIPDTLSQLIRTAFIPRQGYKFIVADFSSIEARVLSFLADEQWRLDVFESGGDIYCASASQMFHVPVEKHGINGHLRQKGKIAELALGYGGSCGALKAMGALDMGLKEDELQPLVTAWRNSNPNIVSFWWDVDRAVTKTVKMHIDTETHGIEFSYKSGMMFIQLPSSRKLVYVRPRIGENQFGSECITYEGIGTNKKWTRINSYGPKFVENIVQAISRDILCYAMQTLQHCFICAHVHDELIIECRKDVSVQAVCNQMGRTPPWIRGLNLRADGFETMFYMKD
ncbi:MAG: DNA polymerase [Clostridiales bacterium]|nr:DNA polymerase [Clostridiales bacterium]